MKIKIESSIGFADSEILDYCRDCETLVIRLKAWNDKIIEVVFRDAVGVEDFGAGDVSALVEEDEDTPFRQRVISEIYERVPDTHPYRSFKFLNLDGNSRLEIIATGVEVR